MKPPSAPISTTADFIELEERLHVWDAALDGVWLWPALREDVMVTINTRHETVTRIKPHPLQVIKPNLWAMHARTLAFLGSPLKRKAPYSGLFVHWTEDRIYPEFYKGLPRPLILESSLFGRFDRSNWRHPQREMLLHDTFKIMERLAGMRLRLSSADQRTISEFSHNVAEQFAVPDSAARFASMIVNHLVRYKFLKPLLERRLLPHLNNRTAFVAVAAYMAAKAAITQVLHEADYTVVEAQHGIINQDHIAYTLPQSVLNETSHPARVYLPDHLLTFGTYWGEQAQLPAQKIVVGFPHLMAQLDQLAATDCMNTRSILFISQWTITDRLVLLAAALARRLPDYHIIYKLHPMEVNFTEKLKPLAGIANLEIVGLANVHTIIARAGMIVGYNSTVLFEALAFPNRRIFVLANDEMPPEIGQAFTHVDELAAYIEAGTSGFPQLSPEEVWADRPTERIAAYLSSQGL